MSEFNLSAAAPTECTRDASQWLMRLQEEDVSEADIAEWLKWCADVENLKAFDDVQRLYDQLRAVEPAERDKFMHLANVAQRPVSVRVRLAEYVTRLFDMGVSRVAAPIVAVLLSVAAGAWWYFAPTSIDAGDYVAARGDQEMLTLADQSHVTLGGETEVSSHFSARVRLVELRKGEAFFEVRHDSARPFVVTANGITVTAVGTKFNVRRADNRTVVVVAEGAVDVSTSEPPVVQPGVENVIGDGSPSTPVRVRAGQQAVREPGHRGLIVSDIDPLAATAWREGRLAYIMEPLGSVIEDVNRYASRRIVVSDPRVNEMTFTGTIFRDHIDNWAMTLVGAFPIVAVPSPDGSVQLSMRPAAR
jgi:transmembrane sensor